MEFIGWYSNLETFLDILALTDIILTFFTSIEYNEKVSPEKLQTAKAVDEKFDPNMIRIAQKYIFHGFFICDFLGCVPSLLTLNVNKKAYILKLFKFMHIRELTARLIAVVNRIQD